MKRQALKQYPSAHPSFRRPFTVPFITLAVLSAFSGMAAAQTTPDAGSLLQQSRPAGAPAASPSGTGLTIQEREGASLPASAPFKVQRIQLTGNQRFDSATLHALVADAEGQTLTLPQLGQVAGRITAYYRAQGYPLARAIIPAQTIRAGVVTIQVLEARYGRIELRNSSQADEALLQQALAPLQSGQDISQAEMERSLLLLADIPGVSASATLKPGEAVGTSDLQVQTAGGAPLSGYVMADNYGNPYTGRERVSGALMANNLLGRGDTFTAQALSAGDRMNYGRLSYELLLDGQGNRLGGAYSSLNYVLGDSLSSLKASGSAEVASLWGRHPLLRSRSANLYAQLQYDRLNLRDRVNQTSTRTERHLDNLVASLTGDLREALGSGSLNTWSLSFTSGQVAFDDRAAQQSDAASARTQGSYSKVNLSLTHSQALGRDSGLYLLYSAQAAQNNLDPSQKQAVGGPASVRAYDVGTISGDNVQLLSAEYRYEAGALVQGNVQLIAFADAANVEVNKTTWTSGANTVTLSGAGAGLNWRGPQDWSVKTSVAVPLDSKSTLVPNTSTVRGWVEVSKRF